MTTRTLTTSEIMLGQAAKPMLMLGIVLALGGLSLGLGLGLRSPESWRMLAHAYLVAFVFYLSITLGALFFVMLHHATRAGWSATLRRLAEALSGNIYFMAVLFLLLVPALPSIYEWARPGAAAEHTTAAKAAYLNPTAFLWRMGIYFAVWCGFAWYLRSRSIRQDASGGIQLSRSMEKVSIAGIIALALTVTFAAVDLLMSLMPEWSSTIFGVYFFTDCVLAGLVAIALLAMWLQSAGRLGDAVTTEHYQDLGKLTFALVFFWGYIAFSQYLLIWYANMPEETQFFMVRQIGPWIGVSIALLLCHLLIPFAGLLSRHAKRRRAVFAFWALWLLATHLLDLYWLVMPSMFVKNIPAAVGAAPGTPLPEALAKLVASRQSVYQLAGQHETFMQALRAPLEPGALAMLLGLVAGLGGLYLINTAALLRGAALVPVEDPRLDESLSFENT
jgi:hypothetical protein